MTEREWKALAIAMRKGMGEWVLHSIPVPPNVVVNMTSTIPAITFLGITWIPDSRIIDLTRKDMTCGRQT